VTTTLSPFAGYLVHEFGARRTEPTDDLVAPGQSPLKR